MKTLLAFLLTLLLFAPDAFAAKITDYPAATTPLAGTELFAGDQAGATKKVTSASIAAIGTVDSIADSDTTHSPSRNAVFDALALKAPLNSPTFVTPVLGVASATSLGLQNGHVAFSDTAPTIASGLCTSPSVSASNGTAAFALTVGTSCTAVTGGTLTLPAATTGWVCSFQNVTNPDTNVLGQTGGNTTTVTFTNYSRTLGTAADVTAGDSIRVMCAAY